MRDAVTRNILLLLVAMGLGAALGAVTKFSLGQELSLEHFSKAPN